MSSAIYNVDALGVVAKLKTLAFLETHAPVWQHCQKSWEEYCWGKSLILESLAAELEGIFAEYERQARKSP